MLLQLYLDKEFYEGYLNGKNINHYMNLPYKIEIVNYHHPKG